MESTSSEMKYKTCQFLISTIIICFSLYKNSGSNAFTINTSTSTHTRSIGNVQKSQQYFGTKCNHHNNNIAPLCRPDVAFIRNPIRWKQVVVLSAKGDDYEEEDEEDKEDIVEEFDEEEWEYEYEVEDGDGDGDGEITAEADGEEYEYEYEEEQYEEEEEGEGTNFALNVPLQDDPDDPLYMEQKRIIEQTIADRTAFAKGKDMIFESDEAPEFLRKNLDEFLDEKLEEAGIKMSDVEAKFKEFEISEGEVEAALNEEMERINGMSFDERRKEMLLSLGGDSDAFPPDDDPIYQFGDGNKERRIKNEDLVKLQSVLEDLVGTTAGYTDGSMIQNKQAMIRPYHELEKLDHQTLDEINMCLNATAVNANGQEYDESIKNEDPLRWLLYDLNFNVTNLMLASCKHNPSAPLLLNHWMPQLCAYSRYADVREREFQFTWDDCESADLEELDKYFKGLGYDEIPTFTPKDTNIISVETEYDQEDMTMSAFENWMDEVYNEEDEDLFFDGEDFQPEHNVFDFDYGREDNDNIKAFKAELDEFKREHANETQTWRDKFVTESKYKYVVDKEGAAAFRGHLVVACCGSDRDLELAEKITLRMQEEFGKQVYVETRVYNHARQEDNVYEIWLESYDIQLLHSRRGAFYNANQWGGPPDVDDEQLEYLVERVRFLISDDARYSYHIHEFFTEV